jgi:hypothetical protein
MPLFSQNWSGGFITRKILVLLLAADVAGVIAVSLTDMWHIAAS